jgi:hypothetical protein
MQYRAARVTVQVFHTFIGKGADYHGGTGQHFCAAVLLG